MGLYATPIPRIPWASPALRYQSVGWDFRCRPPSSAVSDTREGRPRQDPRRAREANDLSSPSDLVKIGSHGDAEEAKRCGSFFAGRRRRKVGLILVIVSWPLPGVPADLVEFALGAPRLRIEPRRAGHRLDIAMRAVIECAAVFRQVTPLAALKLLIRRRWQRRLHRLGVARWQGGWRVEMVGHG